LRRRSRGCAGLILKLPNLHFCSLYVLMGRSSTDYEENGAAKPIRKLAEQVNQRENAMMRLKVEKAGEGLHPSEIIVCVQTRSGPEEIVIDPRSLHHDNTLAVGWPVGREGSFLLVELPRPTSRGSKRVWVSKDLLLPDEPMRATA
jgi:hypothetical protein